MSSYGTLRLDAPMAQKKSRKLAYVAVAMALVGLAATAAVVGSAQVKSSIFTGEYNAMKGDIEFCTPGTAAYNAQLPKYDSYLSKKKNFYNACYFAFRCCSTTGNGDGCYVSDNYGSKCRECLKRHEPKALKDDCKAYIKDFASGKMMKNEKFTVKMMMKGKLPPKKARGAKMSELYRQKWAVKVKKPDYSCWILPGNSDKRRNQFGEKCFDVLSWCNLLCPRDTGNSVGHKWCKHCTLMGYKNEKNPKITQW